MALDIHNLNKFDIVCKTCKTSNVKFVNESDYIKIICTKCEKDKFLSIIDDLTVNHMLSIKSEKGFVGFLKIVLNNSYKAMEIFKEIDFYLNDYCSLFSVEDAHLHDKFFYKQELFKCADKLEGLLIFEYVYVDNGYIDEIHFTRFKQLIKDESFTGEEGAYDLDSDIISFSINIRDFNIKFMEKTDMAVDTIFVHREISGHIESLEKDINKIKDYIGRFEGIDK